MKVLLDECVTKKLKRFLPNFDVCTVTELGWSGIKNGNLLKRCVENNFDVLLTIDKNLVYQQNLDKNKVSIVIFNTISSKIEELITFLPFFRQESLILNLTRFIS